METISTILIMFPDYEKLVLQDYRWKRSKSTISSELMHPTRAKLKKACIELCKGEVSHKDKRVIRDFCKKWDDTKSFLQNITGYDEDKFRPLSDYLNDNTGNRNTDPANIELLACLIQCPHRPYDYTVDYGPLLKAQENAILLEQQAKAPPYIADAIIIEAQSATNKSSLQDTGLSIKVAEPAQDATAQAEDTPSPNGDIKSTPVNNQPDNNPKKEVKSRFAKKWRMGVAFMILLTGYLGYRFEVSPETGGCMYWAGDHYEAVPCDKKIQNTYIVALDTFRLKHFKKIVATGSITYNDKGKVWYSKIKNQLEYFTADGTHPTAINYNLKPITYYIIDTHIHPPGKQ